MNEQSRRPFYTAYPYLGQIMTLRDDAQSFYNGLQAQIKVQATHGLTLSGSYAYSHTNDTADSDYGSYHENYLNPNGDLGPAGYDFHHVLTLAFNL